MKNKFYLFAAALIFSAPVFLRAQVVINEYSCANWRDILDYYQETEDWVELYNPGATAVSLTGYHLSDRKNNPTKWVFPANASISPGGFLRVWCSGRNLKDPQGNFHTNFKLTQTRNNAEQLVFADPSGNILDDLEIEKTQVHQSRGRLTDGSNDWRIFLEPSPGLTNNDVPSAIGYTARPSMDKPAGFYQDSVLVTISVSDPNATIRYTTNGTEPGSLSALYTQPIKVTQTTVIKAMAISNDPMLLPSFKQYNTYFINDNHALAVVSVAGEQLITLANGNQSLRPLGSIEYFNKNGERKARAYGELNSHGQDSWANDQRSLDWVTRDEMGYDFALQEKLFPLTERDEFQRVILRASGDDNYPAAHHPQNEGSAHVRDAYIHNLAKRGGLNLDVRVAEKCIVYLNGQYWGVYDLREIPDDHDYTDHYYGQGKYEIQYVLTWGNTWAEYGGTQAISAWQSIRNFILNNDMNDPVKFQYVKDRYDYTSLIDYVIANSFTVCTDWLNYNTGIWRGLNPEGGHQKWGYILWDNDATFDHYINYTGLPSTQADAAPCNPETLTGGSDPQQHIRVLNKLRTNPEVEQYYLSRQADLMYTVFGCENMLSYLDTIEALIDPEMERHAQRWFGTYNEWRNNLEDLREFITARCTILPSLMDNCYAVEGPFQATIRVEPPGTGQLQVNTLKYQANQLPVTGHYFSGTDIDLLLAASAVDTTTYRFDHWSAGQHTFTDPFAAQTAIDITTADTIVAHFVAKSTPAPEPTGASAQPSVSVHPTIFENEIVVQYYLPETANVDIRLLDVMGKQVAAYNAPGDVSMQQQTYQLSTAGKNLPSGVYFLTFAAGNFEKTVRLIRI
jgi:hypothetical protein